jgi:hypothetical protein
MKLESTSYYQRFRPLDDYIDEFQDLVAESGYTDPMTVVIKFRRGLNPQVQTAVVTMGLDRPSDADPDSWYAMAQLVDENRAANEVFVSSSRPPAPAPIRPSSMLPIRTSFCRHPHSHRLTHPDKPIAWEVPQHQWVQTQAEDVSFRTQTAAVVASSDIGPGTAWTVSTSGSFH